MFSEPWSCEAVLSLYVGRRSQVWGPCDPFQGSARPHLSSWEAKTCLFHCVAICPWGAKAWWRNPAPVLKQGSGVHLAVTLCSTTHTHLTSEWPWWSMCGLVWFHLNPVHTFQHCDECRVHREPSAHRSTARSRKTAQSFELQAELTTFLRTSFLLERTKGRQTVVVKALIFDRVFLKRNEGKQQRHHLSPMIKFTARIWILENSNLPTWARRLPVVKTWWCQQMSFLTWTLEGPHDSATRPVQMRRTRCCKTRVGGRNDQRAGHTQDFGATETPTNTVSYSTLQMIFKKLPLVEC